MTLQELLETVRRVEVRTTRLVNDTMVGAYLSHFKGRGMDFEELREYVPGDDVRDIDWNVTHRMGRPFIKRYREERELGVLLAVDVSGSLDFGSGQRSKREAAVEVAATLAFSAARNGDKVGLLMFSGEVEQYLPPRKGRRQILRILRELLVYEPRQRGTDVSGALAFLNRLLHRRSIIFLITDFLHLPAASSPMASSGVGGGGRHAPGATPEAGAPRGLAEEVGLTNIRHDLVCIHLCDPREAELPAAGLLTLEDAETGELLELDAGREAVRRRYRALNAERIGGLDQTLNRAGVDTIRLDPTEPFAASLQRFFESRRGRRRG